MIFGIGALCATAATICFFCLPFQKTFLALSSTLQKSSTVIRSPQISDHWKERVVLKYSALTFIYTLQLACYLGVIALIVGTPAFLDREYFDFITHPVGIIFLTAVSLVCVAVRNSFRTPKYGLASQILHYMALGNPFVAEASFDIEQITQKPDPAPVIDQKHIFIAGLARAGTTVLMRRFYASNQFTSLTYNDMPFVLMPKLWGRLRSLSPKQSQKEERAHGDGLLVDADSPEALEEVFWRIFQGEDYIERDRLVPMDADDDVIKKFQSYVASILSDSNSKPPRRYLSKNNNNILRLTSIRKAFPNALIIIPFRDPLQQADSLLRMHQRFILEHKENSFGRRYMRWLVHHEFGLDHRPFCFDKTLPQHTDPDNLNYWLEQWLRVYRWLAEKAPEQSVFISYEALCAQLDTAWPKLAKLTEISEHVAGADAITLRQRQVDAEVNGELLKKAVDVHGLLKDKSLF